MVVVLLGVGLVTFPTLGYALLPPACFVALTTHEGQIVTPTMLGRRLTLNPLAVFLALAFWAWLWGPIGAFSRVPLLIVGMVDRQPRVSARRRQAARLNGTDGTFSLAAVSFRGNEFSHARE